MKAFEEVPERDWPNHNQKGLVRVWLSPDFLVQQFEEADEVLRLSVCRTKRKNGRWKDQITWDELQEIKNAVGHRDKCALEVYPEQRNVVNVANMRHLFVVPVRPDFAWGK